MTERKEIFTEPFEVDRQMMMSGWEPVSGVSWNEKLSHIGSKYL